MKQYLIFAIFFSVNLFGFVYTNSYYNFSFDIPDGYFNKKPIMQDKEMVRFESLDKKAVLNIDAQRIKKSLTIKKLFLDELKYDIDKLALDVAYKRLFKNSYVISTFDDVDNMINYTKVWKRGNIIYTYSLDYPLSQKRKYDSVIKALNKGLILEK